MSIMYMISILYCTLNKSLLMESEIAPKAIKISWVLYSIVAPMELCITLLYWSADYDGGEISYVNVMEHGIICLLILIDGVFTSTIPVRLNMFPYFLTVCISYLCWSIIDAAFNIGNGEWGPAYEDDALYEVLNWNQNSKSAAIVSAIVICVLAPLVYSFCWLLSLCEFRRTSRCFCCSFTGSRRFISSVVDGSVGVDDGFSYKDMEMS